jgi:hypothetical protein
LNHGYPVATAEQTAELERLDKVCPTCGYAYLSEVNATVSGIETTYDFCEVCSYGFNCR